jgi:beta-lactam-binding protein with PASTA domain
MKRKLIAIAVATALTTATSLISAQQGKLSDDVVKIGVLTDMSGVYADYGGPGALTAAKMAIEDFGGKMFGKNIEIVNADHQNKPDIAKNVVLELLYNNETITPQSRIPKGSTVDLVLGDGLSGGETSLPDLVGLTMEEANNLLASSSLTVGSVVFMGTISDSASARIVKQNPPYAEGVMVGAGQPVDFSISLGV